MTQPPRLLTAPEVASRLALPVTTVWRMGREGRLPVCRVGSLMRFDPQEIERYIRSSTRRMVTDTVPPAANPEVGAGTE